VSFPFAYDFAIAEVRLRILSPCSLQFPDSFLPFILPASDSDEASDWSVEVFFGTADLQAEERDDWMVFPREEGDPFVRMIPRDKPNLIRLGVPSDMKEKFRTNANWVMLLVPERLLLPHGRLVLHASAVCQDGSAILFTAPSGGGKSTQAALWEESFGSEVINGDKVILAAEKNPPIAYGSPIAGSSGIYRNIQAPVRAIVYLHKSDTNYAEIVDTRRAYMILYSQIVKSDQDRLFNEATLRLIEALAIHVPVLDFYCTPTSEAAEYLRSRLTDINQRKEDSIS
jgi:hypothetical protein